MRRTGWKSTAVPVDPRLPVLAGWGVASDHDGALGVLDLMEVAARRALDAAPALGAAVDLVLVPQGMWRTGDPGRVLAGRLGATARTVVAELGVLQQTLLTRAAADVAAGRAGVVLVVGGEARAPGRRDVPVDEVPPGPPPDEVLRPDGEIITRIEIERGLAVPAAQYAAVDRALAAAEGDDAAALRRRLGALWGAFSEVAAANPDAWDRTAHGPDEIATPGGANRMIASPYTKLLCSQWNVSQAGALVVCSAEVARRHGLALEDCVFPVAAAESNAMIPMTARREVHRCPGFASAGARALELAGTAAEAVDHLDLYSCFPAAVRVQARELGVDPGRTLTVTGGMTFGGGPLNNYVLQSTAAMAGRLRGGQGTTGLVTSVSGMLTKQAVAVWSSDPPAAFRAAEVGEEVRAVTPTCPVVDEADGEGRVVAATVVHERGTPTAAVVLVDLASGGRTVATGDPVEHEVGSTVRVAGQSLR
jgi:acetyl-CoA C-acetyltransferase